jgi:formate-dependent phosphoribosylglycinamide formyltransferase (GAR transformylase)
MGSHKKSNLVFYILIKTSKKMKILLLGSGELGKEFTIAAQRIGQTKIAVTENAPGNASIEVNMLDGDARQNRCQTPT